MPYVLCVVFRRLRHDIIVFLALLLATVRLIEAVYVVVEILRRLWGCVLANAAPFYLYIISYNLYININVNSRDFIGGMAKALRL